MEELTNKQKTILIILLAIPIITLIVFFIGISKVYALDLSDFDDLNYIDVYNSAKDMNTYPAENDSSTMLYSTHNYTFDTNANVSNYNYAIIPINSAYWYIINRVCYWGQTANGYNYTAGGCSLESTMNFSYRFAVKVDGITKPCAYDGAYAICNVKDNKRITGYYLFLYYTIANINIGGTSANSSNTEFKFQSHAPTGIYLSKSKSSAAAINDAIDKEIQAQEEQTDRIMEEDIDEDTKEQVDPSDYNSYKNKEDSLMAITEQADTSNLNVNLDTQTSGTIWNIMTRLINTHTLVYTLFISILSIGIIKLVLAR